jgi:hypothetical protein
MARRESRRGEAPLLRARVRARTPLEFGFANRSQLPLCGFDGTSLRHATYIHAESTGGVAWRGLRYSAWAARNLAAMLEENSCRVTRTRESRARRCVACIAHLKRERASSLLAARIFGRALSVVR